MLMAMEIWISIFRSPDLWAIAQRSYPLSCEIACISTTAKADFLCLRTLSRNSTGYPLAGAAGDYDNDGDVDLYVSGYGRNTLFRNKGNGTFEDVTKKSRRCIRRAFCTCGLVSTTMGDGDLDLYVAVTASGALRRIFHARSRMASVIIVILIYIQPTRTRCFVITVTARFLMPLVEQVSGVIRGVVWVWPPPISTKMAASICLWPTI
jgi:hypothetical protein